MTDICTLSAVELAEHIRNKKISALEATDAYLERIDRLDGNINAYVTVLRDRARDTAKAADRKLANGEAVGQLHGVPISIKDLFSPLAGHRQTMGCKVLRNNIAARSATCVERFEAAGAIILGLTNASEFGHKGVTDNYLTGPTSTPFRTGYNAGGSSGGASASVAAGMAAIAQGGDAGGSVRIPAALSGVVGFKPSYGTIASASRPNAFVSHTPFVQNGPLARTVADAALLLDVMAGHHPRDPMSVKRFANFTAIAPPDKTLRIAFSPDLGVFQVAPEVARLVQEAVKSLQTVYPHIDSVDVTLPLDQTALGQLWNDQISVFCATLDAGLQGKNIRLLDENREHLSPEISAHIERGRAMRAVELQLLDFQRSNVLDAVEDIFDNYDLLICPTTGVSGVPNADDGHTLGPREINGHAVDPTIGWCLTHPFNFTGHPAASVPAGLDKDGLPVGLQIIGRRFEDMTVLQAAAALEQARPWRQFYHDLPLVN
jgi:amidase/aspartyl-tRNA(Asn)/glutamyl-tRNA(Gln) amidotransferase subunit A